MVQRSVPISYQDAQARPSFLTSAGQRPLSHIRSWLVKRENNYAFIDAQNVNLSIQALGWRLDFARFRVYLRDKYSVTKAFLFVGYLPRNERLYQALRTAGYELVFKRVAEKDGVVKGNVDAELVLHTMIQYQNFDKAVIVSSDGDFYCLVQYLLDNRKLERLLIPNRRRFSSLYRKLMGHIHFMDGLERKLAVERR